MPGDFVAKMREIEARVGYNTLQGKDLNSNVYAHYQHEGAWFKRPSGGGPFFYAIPLVAHSDEYLQKIADVLLTEGGTGGMRNAMLSFETHSQAVTGKLTGRLANGHELTVLDNGAMSWHREPTMKPLRDGEVDPLRAQTNERRRRQRRGGL